MKDLSQYPVTFGYGATDGVYYYTPTSSKPKGPLWIGNYHRGDDRACPVGTPVIVNGVEIGLTGNTGTSSDPHCHIGKFIGGLDVNPNHQGFSLEGTVVDSTGYDSTNGNYVRLKDSKGVIWVYLHLNEVKVIKGQILKGGDMPLTDTQLDILIKAFKGAQPTAEELGNKDYKSNPGLAIDTFNNVWGLQLLKQNENPTSVKPETLKPNTIYKTL